MTIDPDRLRLFMRVFYGYGTWSAPLWFVGMEEGGGDSLDELSRRLDAWNGADELVDLRHFHRAVGGTDWFGSHPPIQKTWGKISRIALAAEGRPSDIESVRQHQRDELGGSHGSTALVELFPLPSPSTGHWIYGDVGLPEIATRKTYVQTLQTARIEAIRTRIINHQPRAVVFYGLTYRDMWQTIAGNGLRRSVELLGYESGRQGSTLLVLAPHPVSRGIRDDAMEDIGRYIWRDVNSRMS